MLKPGAYLFVNADNLWRLAHLFDPLMTPVLSYPRRAVKSCLRLLRVRTIQEPPLVHMYSIAAFDRIIAEAGFNKLSGCTLGFGPFLLFKHKVMPDSIGVKLHNRLQHWADRRIPLIQSLGSQYLVVVKKDSC